MNKLTKITNEFEGKSITTLTYKNQPAWIAREVGSVLGYSQVGKRLINNIHSEWSEEFLKNKDFIILSGQELADLKRLLDVGTESVPSRAPSIMLLFETGLNLVLMKTNKPIGVKLRRFLSDEVLPQIVRDGHYLPENETASQITEKERKLAVMEAKERRLLAQHEAREARLWAKLEENTRKSKALAVRKMIKQLKEMGEIEPDVFATYSVVATEIEVEQDFSELKPKSTAEWFSPTQIGELFDFSANRIGRTVVELNIKGNPNYSKPIFNKARGHCRTVVSYLYNKEALKLIQNKLRELKQPKALEGQNELPHVQ